MSDIDAPALLDNIRSQRRVYGTQPRPLFDLQHLKREFVAGGLAGSIGIFVGFPLDLVKVNMQVYPDKYYSARQCFQEMLRSEGVRGLYKGCLPPIVMQGLINSLMFIGESSTLRLLEGPKSISAAPSVANSMLAGCAGGLLQCLVLVPSEVIKCTMQVEANTTGAHTAPQSAFSQTIDCAQRVYRRSGFAGFYQGLGATALREAPSISCYFLSYRMGKDAFTRWQGLETANTLSILCGGALAGAMSWTVVYPFDVIKTYMQISASGPHGSDTAATHRGFLDTTRWLYRTHGARIFARGLSATVLRALPVNATTFYCYETIKRQLHLE